MKKLTVITVIALMVILLLSTLGAGGASNGKTPIIEGGKFVNHAKAAYSPPPKDDTAVDYKIHQRIVWQSMRVEYYDENNVRRLTNRPVNYKVYTLDTDYFNAVEQAFETWDDQILLNLFYPPTQQINPEDYAPSPALDGQNTVSWRNLGLKEPVAVTYYWYYQNPRPTNKTMLEFDIVFNLDVPWSTVRPVPVDSDGNPVYYDVASVATHEVGHTLILFDLQSRNDYWLTMYGNTWMGDNVKDTLGKGDILGIQELYPLD